MCAKGEQLKLARGPSQLGDDHGLAAAAAERASKLKIAKNANANVWLRKLIKKIALLSLLLLLQQQDEEEEE